MNQTQETDRWWTKFFFRIFLFVVWVGIFPLILFKVPPRAKGGRPIFFSLKLLDKKKIWQPRSVLRDEYISRYFRVLWAGVGSMRGEKRSGGSKNIGERL